MIVEELVTLLKFDVVGIEKAKKFDETLDKISEHAKTIAASVTAAVASVGYFAQSVAKETADNYEWAKSVGIAADTFQRFDQVASLFGGNLDDMKGDLDSWARYAKKSGRSVEDIFLEQAKRIEGMTNDVSYAYLKRQNYSDTAIKMIQLGEKELAKQFQNTQVITEKSLESAKKYAMTWRRTTNEISTIVKKGIIEAMPLIEGVVEDIRLFVESNKDLIKTGVQTFFESVAISLKVMYAIIKPVVWILVQFAKIIDKLSFGVAKYILVVAMLITGLTALSAIITVKLITGISSLIATGIRAYAIFMKFIAFIPTAAAGFSAVVSMATAMISALVPAIAAAATATWGFVAALWATGIPQIVIAIAALVAIVIALVKYWDKITDAVFKSWEAIKEWYNSLSDTSKMILKFISYASGIGVIVHLIVAIVKNWDKITDAVFKSWEAIKEWYNSLSDTSKMILKFISYASGIGVIVHLIVAIVKNWDKITDAVKKAYEIVKDFFAMIWNAGIENLSNLILGVYNILGNISGVWDTITSSVSKGIDLVSEFANSIVQKFGALLDNPVVKMFKSLFRGSEDINIQAKMKGLAKANGVAPNVAQASASQISNSKSIVINNNNTVNTSAENGPAIASYLKQTNEMQRAGFGMSGAF